MKELELRSLYQYETDPYYSYAQVVKAVQQLQSIFEFGGKIELMKEEPRYSIAESQEKKIEFLRQEIHNLKGPGLHQQRLTTGFADKRYTIAELREKYDEWMDAPEEYQPEAERYYSDNKIALWTMAGFFIDWLEAQEKGKE